MNIKEFKKLIKERIYQDEECYGEDDETIEKIQTQLTKLVLDNIKEIIEYIKTDCSFCEFQYLTEIICEVISISQNEELVNALYFVCNKYKKESDKYNMWEDVNNARLCLDKYYDESLEIIIKDNKERYYRLKDKKPGDKFYKDSLYILKVDKESMIDSLSKNIPITIDFLKNKATVEDLIYLSLFFSKIAQKTKSKEFVDCVCEVYDKFKDSNDLSSIKNKILYLKTIIKENNNENKSN